MSNKILIIVESPTKIKTLKKFLGDEYMFESSVGHIRDLPEKEFGINLEKDFEPKYVVMPEKESVINKLKKAAKECLAAWGVMMGNAYARLRRRHAPTPAVPRASNNTELGSGTAVEATMAANAPSPLALS